MNQNNPKNENENNFKSNFYDEKIPIKTQNSNNKKEQIKNEIIKKFGISNEEAETILKKLEKRKLQQEATESNLIQNQNIKSNELISKKNNNKKKIQNKIIPKDNTHSTPNKKTISNKQVNTYENSKLKIKDSAYEPNETRKNQNNVDEIISDIIPNYNEEISIELNHVNLTFELTKDKIDTIKESVIRTLKRNKTKKVKFKVLDDISFKINKGEKIGIIGYNGAGKSTLLHVITGVYPPDTGKVVTNGTISPLLSLGAGFDMNYSGRKNIYLNGAVLGYDKKLIESKLEEIIEFSELGEFIDYPIKNYSSGMLAKLGFSIATIVNPDILIIDEILAVGDVNFQKKSNDKIKSLMDGNTTVLLVSHSIPQIRELCNKAIWIDKGRIREIGDVNTVCDNYIKDSEKASVEQMKNIQFL